MIDFGEVRSVNLVLKDLVFAWPAQIVARSITISDTHRVFDLIDLELFSTTFKIDHVGAQRDLDQIGAGAGIKHLHLEGL